MTILATLEQFFLPYDSEAFMSIFGKIWSKITGHAEAATAGTAGSPRPTGGSMPGVTSSSSSMASSPVDVEAIMTDLESKSGHKSNWRHSIVDLMSLLGMENSLSERKELAEELGYTGDMNDSASMNTWLHKQVMKQMAANGGKVPANMLD
ncbi:MAG: DUF3597 domain-containing protein [Gemmatimonadaceae bacterium]